MKKNLTPKSLAPVTGILLACLGHLHGAAVIWEPFDGSGGLNGQPTGAGLTGNWTASGAFQAATGSLSYGPLLTSGNQINNVATRRFHSAGATIDTALADAGLLDEDAELWFSFLVNPITSGRAYVTIGTGAPDGFDRIGGNGGFGVGVRIENGVVHAHGWNDTSAIKPAGQAVTTSDPFLVVGRLSWAQVSGFDDYIDIYLPGTDLVQPSTPASSFEFDFNQADFDTIGFAGQFGLPSVDEIRFGDSYAAVTPIPEPAVGGIFALAVLGLMRRRRL